MKRDILFAGQDYYAKLGCNAFVKSFNSQELAEGHGKDLCCAKYCEAHKLFPQDWWHVFDAETERMVAGEGFFPQCWGAS